MFLVRSIICWSLQEQSHPDCLLYHCTNSVQLFTFHSNQPTSDPRGETSDLGPFELQRESCCGFTCNVCLFCGINHGALMFPWYLLCIPRSIFGPETSNTVSALLQSRSAPVRPQALAVLCNHPELTFPEGTGKPRHGALFSIMSMFIKALRCAGWGRRIHQHTHPSTHPC